MTSTQVVRLKLANGISRSDTRASSTLTTAVAVTVIGVGVVVVVASAAAAATTNREASRRVASMRYVVRSYVDFVRPTMQSRSRSKIVVAGR